MDLTPLNFLPGTQRDGTRLDSDRSVDALWCRWRLGRPRKILGYQEAYSGLTGVPRRIHTFYQGNQTILHIGTGQSLQQVVLDRYGNFISAVDRTPTIFAAGPQAGWTLDAIFDGTSSVTQLVAHSVPDITTVANTTQTIPFIGDITATTPLVPLTNPLATDGAYSQPKIAGGICCVQPYLFDFDINGFVGWSAPNLPNYLGVVGGTSGAGSARVSAQKIVAGMVQRGGGVNSPAALFWSLSEVITAQFIGSPAYFAFNTVSPSSSILAPNTVIEYDGLYLWAGVDRFLMYNGTVVEVPNNQNLDYFFDNINKAYAGKAFATKIPRFGEIWWCAPLFGNTECSHAIIFNLRENCWYDTELPNGGRSAGYFAQGFPYPVMGGSQQNANGNYSLWLHEKGLDEVRANARPIPIRSYFSTPFIGSVKTPQPLTKGTSFERLEADIVQTGDMSIYVTGGQNARSGESMGTPVTLQAVPKTPADQLVGLKSDLRVGRLHFESNALGGNYITGKSILHTTPGGERNSGAPGTPLTNPTWLVTDELQELESDVSTPITEG